ncbi:hypothetical protein ASPWEDRAFT_135102 [Aspergillus wentii DTO 134E9]|uniref:Enoyl reductase (ER) domain-containing protein n=1 Tax=Aspergillus wentii DTO 134E9 TaxID=1073089 RepID=A0A1L9RFE7_ASPWE|nr:uncharacterized protein ASPWEDRAFT_135102 [Aspergillus wentii DTO 134E9]KAI9925426.1 hypothetical protein MW887_005807 [Aspergillus wentii]OJJ33659.1 hypothetical protein ASPWEDRAFT_135102 [Aspergillus wentii DTO 134E9]
MQAAQLVEFNKPYILTTVDIPQIRPNELLVKIHAAGFCHSDLQVFQGEINGPLPMIPSHEPVGIVAKVGEEASTKWRIGDRVGVLNFKNACSSCPGCSSTLRRYGKLDARFCEKRETGGFKHDGAFAEYMVADSATTVALPDSISFEQGAPLLCAGATVWGALNKAIPYLQHHDTIGIVGIGGLGQLGIQFAKALGYRTVAIDNRAESLDLTKDLPDHLKPDATINSSQPDATDQITSFTNGEGLAGIIICTDSIPANTWSIELLRVGGIAVLLGLPPDKWQFDSHTILFRELTLRGNYVASRDETEAMMRLVEEQGIRSQLTVVSPGDIPSLPDVYKKRAFRGRLVVKYD